MNRHLGIFSIVILNLLLTSSLAWAQATAELDPRIIQFSTKFSF
jgi:hypothetical protein